MKKRILPLALSLALCSGMTIPAFAAEDDASFTASGTVVKVEGLDNNPQYVTVQDNKGNIVGTGVISGGSGDVYIFEGADTSDLTVKNEITGETIGKKDEPVTPEPPVSGGSSSGGGKGGGTSIVPATAGGEVSIKTGSHGAVSISPKKPSKGDKVTITVKPDDGYELDSIKVTSDGSAVKLTDEGDGVYTFTMPGDDVTITTSFKAIESVDFAPAQSFRDVAATDWYASAVDFVSERGMMAGNNGLFSPNDNLTRSMMAQILYNVEGGAGSGTRTFPDVKSSDWFAGAVSWAASQGLMDGYGAGNFGPNDSITREQLASILYRYAGVKGYGTSASAELGSFVDGASTSSWAAGSVRWAVGSGLLTGKSGGRLDPTGTATRAEVAQILMNFYTQVAD